MNASIHTWLAAVLCSAVLTSAAAAPVKIEIASGDAAQALNTFGKQTGLQMFFEHQAVQGKKTQAVKGELEPQAALEQLLKESGLTFTFVNDRTVSIQAASKAASGAVPTAQDEKKVAQETDKGSIRLAQSGPGSMQQVGESRASPDSSKSSVLTGVDEDAQGIPEILVKGSRTTNMDIKRSRDAAQPYVILGKDKIAASGAASLEDFLKSRLPMNSQGFTSGESAGNPRGNVSQVNLRGLGTNQTLILVDGHRLVSTGFGGAPEQPDLNGIPLAAVERIEILPTTASGIFGGSATGGVINVILRRDYQEAEINATYENTVKSDTSGYRLNFSTGKALRGGKTNVLLVGSVSSYNALLAGDRDFVADGRSSILENNPSSTTFFGTTLPLGATTNIRSQDGSPLFGPGTPNFTSVPVGYAGGGGSSALLRNAGHYNFLLPRSPQTGGAKQSLVGAKKLASVGATLRHEFNPRLEAFLDLSGSKNHSDATSNGEAGRYTISASAPNNPFGKPILVAVPFPSLSGHAPTTTENRRAVAGMLLKLPKDWTAEFDYTWDRNRMAFSSALSLSPAGVAAITTGALDVLRDLNLSPPALSPSWLHFGSLSSLRPFEGVLNDFNLRASGPVEFGSHLAGTLSLLSAYRTENMPESSFTSSTTPDSLRFPRRDQTVRSASAELQLPLISGENRKPGLYAIDLQVAARFDEYRVNGVTSTISNPTAPVVRASNKSQSVDPTAGIRYAPSRTVMFRASYGTGFLPPAMNQLIANAPTLISGPAGVDPRRGNTPAGPFTLINGGNSQLEPEQSTSTSAGLVVSPSFIPGLRVSLDYTRIKKDSNIRNLTLQQVLNGELALPGRVLRGANLSTDPTGWAGPITLVDISTVNVSEADVEAYDVQLDYEKSFERIGSVSFFAIGSWQPHLKTRLTAFEPLVENAGITSANPPKFKGNTGVDWRIGRWQASWNVQYLSGYLAADPHAVASGLTIRNQGSGGEVKNQAYHDVSLRYAFETISDVSRDWKTRILGGCEITVGARNVFNTAPPFDAGSAPMYYSVHGSPYMARYYASVKVRL